MKFGFHVSIQGGLYRAPERAHTLGCDCFQIFSGSPRSWSIKPLIEEDVRLFRQGMSRYGLGPCVIHSSYLLNLCSEDVALLALSRRTLLAELRRADSIGARYVVVHMGTRKNGSEGQALKLMAQSVEYVLRRYKSTGTTGPVESGSAGNGIESATISPSDAPVTAAGGDPAGVILLLENTSGGGGKLGYRFEHLAGVLDAVNTGPQLGVCLDTAHLFQAGYNIRTRRGLMATVKEFEGCLDPARIHLIHLNDSLTPLGSAHDRHWHIGRGFIGRRGFRRILRHPLFSRLPMIMETPKQNDDDDKQNMKAARRLSAPNAAERIFQYIFATKSKIKDHK